MKKVIVSFFLISTFLLSGCSKSSLTSTQKDISKNAIKLEYKDVTKESPSIGEAEKGSVADILLTERNDDDYMYLICFKKLEPYRNISVYLDGDKLKVFYEEDGTEKSGDTWIIGTVRKKININNILIYKNNKLANSGIGRNFGIE